MVETFRCGNPPTMEQTWNWMNTNISGWKRGVTRKRLWNCVDFSLKETRVGCQLKSWKLEEWKHQLKRFVCCCCMKLNLNKGANLFSALIWFCTLFFPICHQTRGSTVCVIQRRFQWCRLHWTASPVRRKTMRGSNAQSFTEHCKRIATKKKRSFPFKFIWSRSSWGWMLCLTSLL